jgi:hypothetical protein
MLLLGRKAEFSQIHLSVDDRGTAGGSLRVRFSLGSQTMTRIVLSYGIIAGLAIIVTNTVSMELGQGEVWLGFLVMIIAFSSIYVAVRQYRDQTLGGVVTFPAALFVGLGISAIASIVYVLVWELYLAATDFAFVDRYVEAMLQSRTFDVSSGAELVDAEREAEQFRVQYANPLFRLPATFLEVFPVGLVMSLISAALLRNHGTN